MKKKLLTLVTCTMFAFTIMFAQFQPMTVLAAEKTETVSDNDTQVVVPRTTTATTNQITPLYSAPNIPPILYIPEGKVVKVLNSYASDSLVEVTYLSHTGLVPKVCLTY